MQESVSMHKSPTPVKHSRMNQARSEEEEKERERDRKDRGQEADEKMLAQQNKKIIWGTKIWPKCSVQVMIKNEGTVENTRGVSYVGFSIFADTDADFAF